MKKWTKLGKTGLCPYCGLDAQVMRPSRFYCQECDVIIWGIPYDNWIDVMEKLEIICKKPKTTRQPRSVKG